MTLQEFKLLRSSYQTSKKVRTSGNLGESAKKSFCRLVKLMGIHQLKQNKNIEDELPFLNSALNRLVS